MGSRTRRPLAKTGDQAPSFELNRFGEGSATLESLCAQGPVVLAFFKISCSTCQFAFPFLERLHKGAGKDAPRIVAISQDDAEGTAEFHREYGITMPTLLDEESTGYAASDAYGITHVPSMFLVEPSGKISWSSVGFVKAEMEELGERFGVKPFRKDEYVPSSKAG
jgi:peroxiredoxin